MAAKVPNFNFLKNNESDFPYIENVNVYQYDNEFDYGRFDYNQMKLMICTVPWDVGEAHVGNRTISGIGNVVYFGSPEDRDTWFDAIPDSECYRFNTKFKELHRSMEIDVPIPYDMCAKHNYLVVEYSKFANDDSPVMYEGDNGVRKWFWFIREVEFKAPNTTRLHLLDDAFQTWIYDVNVSGMVLERGHAPMFETRANDFLSNPIENNEFLLTEDVTYGEIGTVKHIDAVSLNSGNMYACIATDANPEGTWGSKANNDWKVPGLPYVTQQGQPSVYVFCMAVSSLNTFLSEVSSNYPQFKQTVKGVWFASDQLITLGNSFTFASTTCYKVQATRKTLDLITLNKSQFGYPTRYADMAKLYTSPYAHIEVTDENGDIDVIKIEDSTGQLKVNAAMNTAWPFISIDAQLSGSGGRASKTVTFKNITNRSIDLSGQWYQTLKSWNVPTFAVVLDPAREYDYSTHFDRAQRVIDYTTEKTNADASADTAKTNADTSADTAKANADASADTAQTNEYNSADTTIANAGLTTAANTTIATLSNAKAEESYNLTNYLNADNRNDANYIIGNNATSTIQAAEQQAAISSQANLATSVVSGVASGNIAGAVGGIINGLVGANATMASMTVGNALTAAQAANAQYSNSSAALNATIKARGDATIQEDMTTGTCNANNTMISGSAANNAATQKTNADNTNTTEKANATRDQTTAKDNATRDQTTEKANATRVRDQAISAIQNDTSQAALRAPFEFGEFANGDTSTTKPMAIIAHVVTQNKHAIACAGDEFARYGYMLDRYWEFNGNWNVGKYFTYWKLRDFWVTNLNVPDMYMDKLRFFLFGGVTIWRKPEYIGNVNIYDNF